MITKYENIIATTDVMQCVSPLTLV